MVLAPEAIGLLGAFLAVLLLVMIAFAYRATFGALLLALAGLFRAINIHVPWVGSLGLGTVADAIERVNHAILYGIGVAIKASEGGLVKMWQITAYTLEELGATIGDLAEAVERSLHALVASTIPRLIREAASPILVPVQHAIAALRTAEALAEARLARAVATARAAATAALAVAIARMHRLELQVVAIPGRLGREVGDLRGWTAKQLRRAQRRIGTIEGLLTIAGLTALVAAVLTRLGAGWVRCSKVGRVGRAVCGVDESLLTSVLADTLAIFGTLSLIEFARELEEGAADIGKLTAHFWRTDVPGSGGARQLGHAA